MSNLPYVAKAQQRTDKGQTVVCMQLRGIEAAECIDIFNHCAKAHFWELNKNKRETLPQYKR